jgi:hypothetical protein
MNTINAIYPEATSQQPETSSKHFATVLTPET